VDVLHSVYEAIYTLLNVRITLFNTNSKYQINMAKIDKKELMIDVKVMQTAFIIREDLPISHKQIQEDYSAEMKMIAFAIGSIVEKATGQGQDKQKLKP